MITQLKRNLTGFWVAHPDFVRIGLALIEAWKQHVAGDTTRLERLVKDLLDTKYHSEVLDFILGADIEGLSIDDPLYMRSLIVADVNESRYVANNHPEEIRYNVFQSLQYFTEWLCGNGCVALPALIDETPVRVMDDLATAERSRWEVWHEIYHGRFALDHFLTIVHEEMHYIRQDLCQKGKIVQVKWSEFNAKWYPVAMNIMILLMTSKQPPEFATELLLPFTLDCIRNETDPWQAAHTIDPQKYKIEPYIERFNYYFRMCGGMKFAASMAKHLVLDYADAEACIRRFSKDELIESAYLHGDIGEVMTAMLSYS